MNNTLIFVYAVVLTSITGVIVVTMVGGAVAYAAAAAAPGTVAVAKLFEQWPFSRKNKEEGHEG